MTAGSLCALEEVTVAFGSTVALREVSFALAQNEVTFLLGANGSGKSTALRVLAGLLTPTKGKRLLSTPRRVALASHLTGLYRDLTVAENLSLYRALVAPSVSLKELVERWGLHPFLNKKLGEISQGTRARCSLCRVEMLSPDILLLDEPTSHLDEHGVAQFYSLMASLTGRTPPWSIVIATHDLQRLEPLMSRGILLSEGSVAGTTDSWSRDELLTHYRLANR